MGNMSYCRFRNTLPDLEDCAEHISDVVSEDEERARDRLVQVCKNILEELLIIPTKDEN